MKSENLAVPAVMSASMFKKLTFDEQQRLLQRVVVVKEV